MAADTQPQRRGLPSLPIIYGYVRYPVLGGSENGQRGGTPVHFVDSVKTRMAQFCVDHCYVLGTVFTDQPTGGPLLERPGFRALLDVCDLLGTHGVLVDSLTTISTTPAVVEQARRAIGRTTSRLIIIGELAAESTARQEHHRPSTARGIIASGTVPDSADSVPGSRGRPRKGGHDEER